MSLLELPELLFLKPLHLNNFFYTHSQNYFKLMNFSPLPTLLELLHHLNYHYYLTYMNYLIKLLQYFGSKKISVTKKLWPRIILVRLTSFGVNKFWPKIFWVKKLWVKKMGLKNKVKSQKLWVQKFFSAKNKLGLTCAKLR